MVSLEAPTFTGFCVTRRIDILRVRRKSTFRVHFQSRGKRRIEKKNVRSQRKMSSSGFDIFGVRSCHFEEVVIEAKSSRDNLNDGGY